MSTSFFYLPPPQGASPPHHEQAPHHQVDQETVKKEVASLLRDVPGASLPLFKFREMFEKRYGRSVSSSDLYRLKGVVLISEGNTTAGGYSLGRSITLSNEWKRTKEDRNFSLYCNKHPPKDDKISRKGWAEKEADLFLPNVMIELKTLGGKVVALLSSHDGGLPLMSFMDCYEAEFGLLESLEGGGGVPLEHLLGCIQGVEITMAENGTKRLQWIAHKPLLPPLIAHPPPNCVPQQPPPIQHVALQLAQFGREMVDLLKTLPRCSLAFSKLIPAYHHHFGRQCRVADYGHLSLQSLLQTIPHVIQIMGTAQNKILTLSHRAQMKRFTTDMLRVLKAHGGVKKQIKMEDFPQSFSTVFPNRDFFPEDYGLCYFPDLVHEMTENSTLVALVKEQGNQMLAVPKREQTPQEIHRTRIFASEVVELFRHSIRYEMPFSKFIPAYHHHYGKQCRVSNYGFSKLAELFEAITDTVTCTSLQGPSDFITDDKIIRLVPELQLKVVGEQLRKMIEKHSDVGSRVRLADIDELFIEEQGFHLAPEQFDAEDIEDLVKNQLTAYLKVDSGFVSAVDQSELRILMQNVTSILEKHSAFKMDLDDFLKQFTATYTTPLTTELIQGRLCDMLILSEKDDKGKRSVTLAPMRIFARELTQLLEDFGGSLMLSNVDAVYMQKYGRPLRPAQMGYPSLIALLQAIPEDVEVRGKHRAKRVCITGTDSSEESSFEETRSYKGSSRHNDSFSSYSRNNHNSRCYSSDQYKPYNNHLNIETGRLSDSPNKLVRNGRPPPLSYTPLSMAPPPLYPSRGAPTEPTIFTFDRAAPLSPPMYDLWMQKPMSPGSPPISPPIMWTYHPIVYPPNTPPATGNIILPSYSYSGQWSPAALAFDRSNADYQFAEQQNGLSHGLEHITMEGGGGGRNEA